MPPPCPKCDPQLDCPGAPQFRCPCLKIDIKMMEPLRMVRQPRYRPKECSSCNQFCPQYMPPPCFFDDSGNIPQCSAEQLLTYVPV